MRVLITSGGTREPIDGVRYITNFSTGQTGLLIAKYFASQGADVTHLHAVTAPGARAARRLREFDTFTDLDLALQNELSSTDYNAVLHAAAVSDFALESVEVDGEKCEPGTRNKLSSTSTLRLTMRPTFKILERLRGYDRTGRAVIVGFKLTRTHDPAERERAIHRIAHSPQVDLIVHNDLSEISGESHITHIYSHEQCLARGTTKLELAQNLWRMTSERVAAMRSSARPAPYETDTQLVT